MRIATAFLLFLLAFSVTAYADALSDGRNAFARGDYKTAFDLWEPLAGKGDITASTELCYKFIPLHSPNPIPATAIDPSRALDKKSQDEVKDACKTVAEIGDSGAAERFAQTVTENSPEEALAWYQKADGNKPEMLHLLRMANEENNPDAQYALGVYYGCIPNAAGEDEKMKWWRKAAENGNKTAQYATGTRSDKPPSSAAGNSLPKFLDEWASLRCRQAAQQ